MLGTLINWISTWRAKQAIRHAPIQSPYVRTLLQNRLRQRVASPQEILGTVRAIRRRVSWMNR